MALCNQCGEAVEFYTAPNGRRIPRHVFGRCGADSNNYGRSATPEPESLSPAMARQIWRSFVNPNARCPVCRAPVYYYESKNGGRVFFDQLGWPWPKHGCTDRPTWRWPADTGFRLKEEDVQEPINPPIWRREGWVPVAKFEWSTGLPNTKSKNRLTGGIVWSAEDASEVKVFWPWHLGFDWNGLVMMREDPRSLYRIEFKTFWLDDGVVRVQRLVAVKNDPLTNRLTLLSRLRDKR
jgi:hypothetical protein